MRYFFLTLLTLATSVLCVAQTPIAHYPFSGNANDAIGTNHGTVNGATLSTDRFGNANSAYSFDGSLTNYIKTTNLALTQSDNFTMSAWIKPANLNQIGFIMQNGDITGNVGHGYGLAINDGSGNNGTGNVLSAYYAGIIYVNSGGTFSTANIWYHVVLVRINGTAKFYINGTQTANTSAASPNAPIGSLIIGGLTGGGNFNGAIDEVKIFNTALTPAQVLAEFNADAPAANYASQFGNSVLYNGINDAITIPSNSAVNLGTGNFGVEFWYKSPANNKDEIVFEKRDDGCSDGKLWAIRKTAANELGFNINVPGPTSQDVFIANAFDNNWHHVAFIRNGMQMLAYKDGQLVASLNTTSVEDVNNTANLGIGTGACSSFLPGGGFFTGSLDEVRIWNTARTATDIQNNMNAQLAGTETGLVGYWDMNRNGQGAGLTVENKASATGAGLNGTTVGTVNTPVFTPAIPPVAKYASQFGNSVLMNGSTDNIDLGTSFTQQNFTVEMWLKPGATQQTYADIIDNNHAGSFTNWVCQQDGDNVNKYAFGTMNTGAAFTLTPNVWQHLTLVKSATTIEA
jgi:hypothetical protein